MAERTPMKDLRLPSYRGEMLLLKYLELRVQDNNPPNITSLPEDFDYFVAPLNEGLQPPRPPERALRYLDDLINLQYARVVDRANIGKIVELTPVGDLSAQGIGLSYELKAQWEKQKEHQARAASSLNNPNS